MSRVIKVKRRKPTNLEEFLEQGIKKDKALIRLYNDEMVDS